MNNSLKIAVINGGSSAEASVSRRSAENVIKALKENYTLIESIELDSGLTHRLEAFSPDIVLPILHGPPGEDGTLQGYLDILGLKYIGSGVHASSIAMDKVIAKQVFAAVGLPLAKQKVYTDNKDIPRYVDEIRQQLGENVVVKPATQGSTLGITLVEDENTLHSALKAAFEFDDKVLIEERIFGREMTVAVLDTDDGPIALPVIDIQTKDDVFYDFEHKYTEGLSEHIVPANISADQSLRLQSQAISAHVALGCRDLSRADFIVPNENEEVLLEVNTLPGMTPASLYPDAAKAHGLTFGALMKHFVDRALKRKA